VAAAAAPLAALRSPSSWRSSVLTAARPAPSLLPPPLPPQSSVRSDDVDLAISVLLKSVISSQKYAVKREMERKFGRYLSHKQDVNELLLFHLQRHYRQAVQLQSLRATGRSQGPSTYGDDDDDGDVADGGDIAAFEVRDFENTAQELSVSDLEPFYTSTHFTGGSAGSLHGFTRTYSAKGIAVIVRATDVAAYDAHAAHVREQADAAAAADAAEAAERAAAEAEAEAQAEAEAEARAAEKLDGADADDASVGAGGGAESELAASDAEREDSAAEGSVAEEEEEEEEEPAGGFVDAEAGESGEEEEEGGLGDEEADE
jgi:hypothetical protein